MKKTDLVENFRNLAQKTVDDGLDIVRAYQGQEVEIRLCPDFIYALAQNVIKDSGKMAESLRMSKNPVRDILEAEELVLDCLWEIPNVNQDDIAQVQECLMGSP